MTHVTVTPCTGFRQWSDAQLLPAKLREFRYHATLTREALAAVKLAKFRRFVATVAVRSRFYARILAEGRITVEACTPEDFPELTKATFIDSFDEIVIDPRIKKHDVARFLERSVAIDDLYLDTYRVIHSSGTSGEPGYFLYSARDWIRGMAQAARPPAVPRRRPLHGAKPRLAFYGAVNGHFATATMMKGLELFGLDVCLLDIGAPLSEVVETLNRFRPDYLNGYTNVLLELCDEQRRGTLRIAPLGVGVGGESLSPKHRAELRERFGCEPTNTYGSSEHLFMGVCGPGAANMTLYDDDLIYEIAEDHTLVTNLFNFSVPLIRYRMSDVLRPAARASQGPYLEIESLIGRAERVPHFLKRDGTREAISPMLIMAMFIAGVRRFQMHVLGPTHFCFRICLDPHLSASGRANATAGVTRWLHEMLARKALDHVRFDVVVVEALAADAVTGKFQTVVHEPANGA